MSPSPAHWAHWSDLETPQERACARLALLAMRDMIHGGCYALLIAERSDHKQFPAREIVGAVYSTSTGRHHPGWEAWACPECGQVHLGQEAALGCCRDDGLEPDEDLEAVTTS